jgi:hypothetical protein
MSAVFYLDHTKLAGDPRFSEIAGKLSEQSRIDSRASFNHYCQQACRLWKDQFGAGIGLTSSRFTELLNQIDAAGKGVIRTTWGGVVVTLHEHPRVEKYLVIRKGGYLALETHEEKDERLQIEEGAGLILSRQSADRPLTVEALLPGEKFHFEPGMEHCIIGTENLLAFERSIDPKGMDQDLVFIYEPDVPDAK